MPDTIITIDDTAGPTSVRVEPELHIIDQALRGSTQTATPAQVYATAALNALRDFTHDPNSVKLPRMAAPAKGITLKNQPVHSVVIRLSDRLDGGVTATSNPQFSTLLAMVAGGSTITQVHQYALVALGRIYRLSRETKR
jgi:hypothetical protein